MVNANSWNKSEVSHRFWARVLIGDECWEWIGAINNLGYGQTHIDGRQIGAHRAAWLLRYGDTGGLQVLHRCDNRKCVRPTHLYLGTQLENMRDMIAKGRDHYIRQKLTPAQAREIRARKLNGETAADLAIEFGIHKSTVWEIANGSDWARLSWRPYTAD